MKLSPRILTLYRIQNAAGRGPFQRDLGALWMDPDRSALPSMDRDVTENMAQDIWKQSGGGSVAFGCRTRNSLYEWFSYTERQALEALGFFVHKVVACRPIMEGPNDILFFTRWPLHLAIRVP